MTEARSVIKVPVSGLPERHHDVFEHAVRNVLSTETARTTYAQIIDGFPIASVAQDKRWYDIDYEHPVFKSNHDQLCPGAWEKMEEFHASFDIDVLSMDERVSRPIDLTPGPSLYGIRWIQTTNNINTVIQLLHAYSAESVGSRAFQLRLIEMVAVAVHQLAVMLHKLGDLKQHDEWKSWKPPNRYIGPDYSPDPKPYPTLFVHCHFRAYPQYPDGVADMVGYWAENRILGGVVLFDRGESGNQCREVFFHSDRKNVTDRIYALTEEQKQNLSAFFAHTSNQQSSLLPIVGDSRNRVRVNHEDAVFMFHVYRDRWEREVLDYRQYPRRCKEIALDYPEMEDDNRN
ncbi:uncharacterized protein B0H64DRAFT_330625 [Chaetomium fimeti]|uniref:Uncharacterized protein n=1 Tax=Chaetomium fimeti TaxID=1854472 RepID=A0AAE0H885_9PEZI|nr:hypothetical protein B0H64DRAFT_330625 [Chaetomium fimeti]